MTERRYYDPEFKKEAVKLVVEENRKVKEVAENLGIRYDQLHKWKQKYLKDKDRAFPVKGNLNLSPKDMEIYKLKKKLKDTEIERDILKKAVGIFSKSQK